MWKCYRGQRDKSVTEEIQRRDSFASEQWGQRGRRKHGVSGATKSSHAHPDYNDGNNTESQKENSLKCVDPCRSAHAAKKDVAHDDQSDNRPTKPIGDEAAANHVQRGATAHNADDDVGNKQHCLHHEDYGADVSTLPTIAKHLYRRHEAKLLAERPDTRAHQENCQRDHQSRGRGHQAKGDDAV